MTALQNNDQYVGQLLIRDGVIKEDELERGLIEQRKERGFLCSHLVRLGFASEEKIFSILSLQIGVPFITIRDMSIDPLMLSRIPANFALACQCLPLKMIDDVFFIAMADPLNTTAVEEIKAYLGVEKLKVFLVGEQDLRENIRKYYGV